MPKKRRGKEDDVGANAKKKIQDDMEDFERISQRLLRKLEQAGVSEQVKHAISKIPTMVEDALDRNEMVLRTGIKRESGYHYFVGKDKETEEVVVLRKKVGLPTPRGVTLSVCDLCHRRSHKITRPAKDFTATLTKQGGKFFREGDKPKVFPAGTVVCWRHGIYDS